MLSRMSPSPRVVAPGIPPGSKMRSIEISTSAVRNWGIHNNIHALARVNLKLLPHRDDGHIDASSPELINGDHYFHQLRAIGVRNQTLREDAAIDDGDLVEDLVSGCWKFSLITHLIISEMDERRLRYISLSDRRYHSTSSERSINKGQTERGLLFVT